jgi:hypothetical protein
LQELKRDTCKTGDLKWSVTTSDPLYGLCTQQCTELAATALLHESLWLPVVPTGAIELCLPNAEVNNAANADSDGTEAGMLSAENADLKHMLRVQGLQSTPAHFPFHSGLRLQRLGGGVVGGGGLEGHNHNARAT